MLDLVKHGHQLCDNKNFIHIPTRIKILTGFVLRHFIAIQPKHNLLHCEYILGVCVCVILRPQNVTTNQEEADIFSSVY